jgi:pimeloyl-ACP methyl ester carboxylesterase
MRRRAVLVLAVGLTLGVVEPAIGALPPGTRTTAVRGIRIAHRETGAGRPLLLVNGSGATLDTWDPSLLAGLGRGRRIIVLDPRGMGGSTDVAGDRLTVEKMADDAAALLRALHIKHVDVLGWSLGGFVAQELAIRHPALVRRLVLASSSPGGRHATKATPKVTAIDEKSTIGLASPNEFLPILFPQAAQGAGQAWIQRLLAQPGGCCEPYSQQAGRRQVSAGRRWFAASGGDEQRLARISSPTLIGAGALDVDVPVANARLLHHRITGSKLVIYHDAGHAFLIQHATQFAGAVLRFLG